MSARPTADRFNRCRLPGELDAVTVRLPCAPVFVLIHLRLLAHGRRLTSRPALVVFGTAGRRPPIGPMEKSESRFTWFPASTLLLGHGDWNRCQEHLVGNFPSGGLRATATGLLCRQFDGLFAPRKDRRFVHPNCPVDSRFLCEQVSCRPVNHVHR